MEQTAIFTITSFDLKENVKGYNIKCKAFNRYNRYYLLANQLFTEMEKIADIFNNELKIAVLFEVG